MRLTRTSVFFTLILCALFAITGCTTTTKLVENNVIRSKNIEINQEFKREDYIIIGKITGTSEYVTLGKKGKCDGDTKKYGYINDNQNLAIARTKKQDKKLLPLEIARQNACYELIDKANDMGADTILEPLEQIETKIETTNHKDKIYYKVTMTALAVQVRRDN